MDINIAPGDTVKVDGDSLLYVVQAVISETVTKAGAKFGPQARLVNPLSGKVKWIALADKRIKVNKIGS
jgi:hypothetical protein